MSETPRTSLAFRNGGIPELFSEAKDLERELAAANRKIQRLVEAGDKVDAFCVDENAHLEWTAAKEESQ